MLDRKIDEPPAVERRQAPSAGRSGCPPRRPARGPRSSRSARGWWIGPSVATRRWPEPPHRSETSSAAIEIAVSSGVRAPMSSPIGAAIRAMSSSVTPAARSCSARSSFVRRLPMAPMYAAGVRSATCRSGTSNFGSWVSTQITVRRSTGACLEERCGQALTTSCGLGEPFRRGEHRAGVAHRHAITQERADPGHRSGEVDRAEHVHVRRRRVRGDEHREVVEATLAVGSVATLPGRPLLQHAPRVVGDRGVEPRAAQRAGGPVGPDREVGAQPAGSGQHGRDRDRLTRS